MQINPINNSNNSLQTGVSFKQLVVDKDLPLKIIGKVARNKEISKLTELLHKDGYDLRIYNYHKTAYGTTKDYVRLAMMAKLMKLSAGKDEYKYEGIIELIPENSLFKLNFVKAKCLYQKFLSLKSQKEQGDAKRAAYEKESFNLIDALNKRLTGSND